MVPICKLWSWLSKVSKISVGPEIKALLEPMESGRRKENKKFYLGIVWFLSKEKEKKIERKKERKALEVCQGKWKQLILNL